MSRRPSVSGANHHGADAALGLCARCLVRPWTTSAFQMSVCEDCARTIRSNRVALVLGAAFAVALIAVVARDFRGVPLRDLVVLAGGVTALVIMVTGHTFVNRVIR